MVAESGTFDVCDFGKGLAELAEEFMLFVRRTLWLCHGRDPTRCPVPKEPWDHPTSVCLGRHRPKDRNLEEDGGGKSEKGNRVFGVSPLTVLADPSGRCRLVPSKEWQGLQGCYGRIEWRYARRR